MRKVRVLARSGVLALSLIAVAVLLTFGLPALAARAADHLDGPGLTPPGGIGALDITDLYAFQSPSKLDHTVLVMAVNALTAPGVDKTFIPNGVYRFNIDNTGDAMVDVMFTARFGRVKSNGSQPMSLHMKRAGQPPEAIFTRPQGSSTPPGSTPIVIQGAQGVKAFAGMRDDPFFFDLNDFLAINFCGNGADTFAGTNVSAIVIEVPNSLLMGTEGSNIGVWSVTRYRGARYDRMGFPAISTVFIPNNPFEPTGSEFPLKFAYNQGLPKNDQKNFRDEIVDTLSLLFTLNDASGDDTSDDAAGVAGLADFLLPDILPIDLSATTGFPNGRGLDDDVIDVELGLITEGAVPSDCVDGNDVSHSSVFPYVADPH